MKLFINDYQEGCIPEILEKMQKVINDINNQKNDDLYSTKKSHKSFIIIFVPSLYCFILF